MSERTQKMAKELVAQMTIEEKIDQMLYQSPAIERLKIPAYNWWNEALHGVARAGVATSFPQAIGMAATFDKNLLKEIGDAVSTEGRAKFNAYSKKGDRGIYKGLTFWAPNINIFRDPRWGRGHETYGEDPVLTAELGCAYIKGLQGEDKKHPKAAACAKHFAVHSGPESDRHSFDAKVSQHDLYDTYLYAFKRCVQEAGVEAVMGAYNRVNGEPACGSKTLLTDILRNKWGFKGHVVSDCWAILDFHEHHKVTATVAESAAMAVNNGCDLNCGSAFLHLHHAYEQGLVTKEAITKAVERLMEIRIRLGMLEEYPSPYADIAYDKVECKEHIALALDAARRSLVLLKNKDQCLPLQKEQYRSIAVIGPNANSRDALIGNYTGTSSSYITPLEGIQQYVGDKITVRYAQGCDLYKDKVEFLAKEKDRFAEAITVAEQSDVVVLCLGLDATIEGEEGDAGNEYGSGDKSGIHLPGLQQELLEAVTAIGRPTILLLLSGSALDVSWAQEHVDAILQCWYPGARGGKAIAEALFGTYSPSGRLPVTFYKGTKDLPDFRDYSMKGRTYRYCSSPVLYPFGYGLSYTDITYTDIKIDRSSVDVSESVNVTVHVQNCGDYPVWECVQAYVRHEDAASYEPGNQLKAICPVYLAPGEKKEITMTLHGRDFARIEEDGRCMAVSGTYRISVGGQQPDARSAKLTGKKDLEVFLTRTGNDRQMEEE